jgi:hypothetical protein
MQLIWRVFLIDNDQMLFKIHRRIEQISLYLYVIVSLVTHI